MGGGASGLDASPVAPGDAGILETALPAFEEILIQVALEHTGGRRQEAAKLLGWGRNTLTRKIKELNLDFGPPAPAEDDDEHDAA
jgi:two-component system nitrogen regulation response regulator GlnG